jgi:hypothetical protein
MVMSNYHAVPCLLPASERQWGGWRGLQGALNDRLCPVVDSRGVRLTRLWRHLGRQVTVSGPIGAVCNDILFYMFYYHLGRLTQLTRLRCHGGQVTVCGPIGAVCKAVDIIASHAALLEAPAGEGMIK